MLLGAPAVQAYDYYEIVPSGTTTTAGTGFTVDIFARHAFNGSTDTNYDGTATLDPGSGAGTFAPTGPVAFSNGIASGVSVTITAAGGHDLVVSDTATTISSWAGYARINPGNAAGFIILRQSPEIQQLHTPGVAPGYSTPYPLGVTVTAGVPCAVTVHVVDQHYNTVPGLSGNIYLDDSLYNGGVVPTVRSTTTGIAEFMWTPNPAGEGQITFEISGNGDYAGLAASWINRWNYVTIQDTFYIWIDAPSTPVTAGVPFPVTVTVSTSNVTRIPTGGANSYEFRLEPMLPGLPPTDGRGTLSPAQIAIGDQGYDGKGLGLVQYTTAEQIYLNPIVTAPSNPKQIEVAFSQILTVQAGAPVTLQASVSPASIQANHQATITARVEDAYANPVPDVPVQFIKFAGSADATVAPTHNTTNASGTATSTFTGGVINEAAGVSVVASALREPLWIDVSVASPDGNIMVNYPNPFNPHQRTTSINYFLKAESDVEIWIHDAFGRLVFYRKLAKGEGSGNFAEATRAGGANFNWDGRNGEGRIVANGIYLVKVKARNEQAVQEFERRVGVLK